MKTIKTIFRFIFVKPCQFIQKYFKTCFFLFAVFVVMLSFTTSKKQDLDINLAKIYLEGPIFSSDMFAKQIDSLRQFPNIKGVLLVINSPGGALSASVEIADMIKELNEQIPVVSYVQGTMASGSYYAGMYSKYIIANRGSMIGSIGVIFNGYDIEDLMKKIGVKSQSLHAGEYKEVGTFTRAWNKNEKEYLQNVLNQQYDMFVTDVANARRLNKADYKNFAEGKVFNAYDAKKLGLIDLVGTQRQAISILQEVSGVKEPVWAKEGIVDSYLKKISANAISEIFTYLSSIK